MLLEQGKPSCQHTSILFEYRILCLEKNLDPIEWSNGSLGLVMYRQQKRVRCRRLMQLWLSFLPHNLQRLQQYQNVSHNPSFESSLVVLFHGPLKMQAQRSPFPSNHCCPANDQSPPPLHDRQQSACTWIYLLFMFRIYAIARINSASSGVICSQHNIQHIIIIITPAIILLQIVDNVKANMIIYTSH